MLVHSGPAKVFNSEEEAVEAITGEPAFTTEPSTARLPLRTAIPPVSCTGLSHGWITSSSVSAVLKRLAENGRLHTDCKTVALKTQGEIAAAAHVVDEDVIQTFQHGRYTTCSVQVFNKIYARWR